MLVKTGMVDLQSVLGCINSKKFILSKQRHISYILFDYATGCLGCMLKEAWHGICLTLDRHLSDDASGYSSVS